MIAALPRRSADLLPPRSRTPETRRACAAGGPGTYTVICRDPYGKQKWVQIGSTAELAIADARVRAREVIRRIEAGLEPFEAPKPQPDSVAAVAATWLIRHVEKKGLRTADEMRRIIEVHRPASG